jgi:hypothetical protein
MRSKLGFGLLSIFALTAETAVAAPTDGWTTKSWTYTIHKPYDLAISDRFKYASGVWTMWVYTTDKPFESGNTTLPRSEMRWANNYTSGNRMWDGDVYVPSGTFGTNIQQVFGGTESSTGSMIRVYSTNGGELRRYSDGVLATAAYNKWLNVKVAHDANNNQVKIYVANALIRTDPDRGNATHYFKNGVYTQSGASSRMECRFRNLKQWSK